MSNIGGSNDIEDYIDLFNEYFYENIYDIFLNDELDIGESIHELFNDNYFFLKLNYELIIFIYIILF